MTVEAFEISWQELARGIDDLLLANHAMRAALKPGHPPFDASLTEGLEHFGPGPVFALWAECRAVERIRFVWTGKRLATVAIEVPQESMPPESTPEVLQ